MLNHSCVPNVAHQFERKSLVFYAVCPIAVGEPLCFCYMSLEKCTLRRQGTATGDGILATHHAHTILHCHICT